MSNEDVVRPVILAVDDNEIHGYALAKTFQKAGYNVVVARNGSDAIRLAIEKRPQAILLDINLPDVNGYVVCVTLRQVPETRDTPIIFHTASSATFQAREQAEEAGATAFLTYPVEESQLLWVIRGSLAKAAHAH